MSLVFCYYASRTTEITIDVYLHDTEVIKGRGGHDPAARTPMGGSARLQGDTALLMALTVALSAFAGPVQRYAQAAAQQLGDRAAYGRAVLGEGVQTTRPYRFDTAPAPEAPR